MLSRPGDAQEPTARPQERLDDALDLLAAMLAAGLIALVSSGEPSLPRLLLTLGFAAFTPGRAVLSNWRAASGWSAAGLAMVLSIAIGALLATVTLWAHAWHPVLLFQAEAVACLIALAAGALRRHRAERSPAGRSQAGRSQAGRSQVTGTLASRRRGAG